MVEFKKQLDIKALEVNALIQGDAQDGLQQNSADVETHMQSEHKRNLHNIAAKVNGEYNSRCTMLEDTDMYDVHLTAYNSFLDIQLEQAKVFGDIPEDFLEFIGERRRLFTESIEKLKSE